MNFDMRAIDILIPGCLPMASDGDGEDRGGRKHRLHRRRPGSCRNTFHSLGEEMNIVRLASRPATPQFLSWSRHDETRHQVRTPPSPWFSALANSQSEGLQKQIRHDLPLGACEAAF